MTYPEIPDLPPAPIRMQPEDNYAAVASTFVGAMTPWAQAVNAAGQYVEQAAADADDAKTAAESARDTAQSAATTAGNRALDAEGAANEASQYAQIAASTANFKGEWGDLTGPLSIPASVYHSGAYWNLLNDIADVTLSEPGVSADWVGVDTDDVLSWTAISTSTTLAANTNYAVTFSSALNLTLPGSPTNNDRIRLYRSGGDSTGSVVIRNGNTIMGVAEDMTIDSNITSLELVFNGSDWRVL